MLNIEVYPLNCIIYPDKDSDLDIIRPWAKNYIRWNEYWNKWQKRKVVTPAANYVFFRRDRKQVNILRTMFDDLIGYLAMSNYIEGVHYRVIQKKLDIDIDYEYRLTTKDGWTPRGEQIDLIDFASKKDYGAILMGLLMGVGKSASLATHIRVPGGWRKMGSLRVGDKIYAYNGEITTVMSVHPQGLQPIYRVHVDGFRYVDVTLDHLFKIIRIDNTDVDITATTTELIKLLSEGKKLYIPHNGKIEEGKKLTIDDSVIDVMYFIKQFFIDEESNLNTIKLDSLVTSSYQDRKAFVDILIKVLAEEGKDTFRDNRVLDYIKELVFSIGYGIESVEEGEFVRIKIKEKVERVLIKKIERVGDSYAQCISIDHPSQLYLTKDYVVNHNTSSSLFLAEKFQQRLVCILRPNLGGQAEHVDNLIRTPGGWTRMGDIGVGDKVYDENSNLVNVTAVTDVSLKPLYEVLFLDGRKVYCSGDHIWQIWRCINTTYKQDGKRVKGLQWRVENRTTEDLAQGVEMDQDFYVPLINPGEGEEKMFYIDPYVLGVYLGDGSHDGIITKSDLFIHQKVESLLPPDLKLLMNANNKDNPGRALSSRIVDRYRDLHEIKECGFQAFLRENDLDGKVAHNKFIPDKYMQGSTEQKIRLLQGLIDTDGYVDGKGVISISTTSKRMALQIRELIWSIGGMCRVVEKRMAKLGPEYHQLYNVWIRYRHPDKLVTLPRKLERIFTRVRSLEQTAFTNSKLKIFDIKRIGIGEVKCITVDNPTSLYTTQNYIVTHNCPDTGWFKELAKATTLDEKEICVVRGRKDLQSLINMGLAKELPYRAILISNKTFQYYLKYYEEYTDEEFEGLGWNCSPKDLPNVLGVDTIFLDEVHLDSHLQCKMISYLGCKRILGASATIKPSSKFIDRMSKLSFPVENRYMQKHVTAYIQPTAFHYKFEKPQFIRCEGSRGYNHVKFEQSVMRHVGVKKAYFKMVKSVIQDRFISRFHLFPNSKCLVVVSTINMAKEMTTYLREQYPDLKVNSYVADDPQENVFGSNITVSTIGSSGVGLDIPDLNTVILTVAISSKQTNLQVAGRLRFLGEGIRHEFIYFVCDDIASHVKYDVIKRNEVFPGSTCLNGVHWYSNIELGNRYANDKNR